MNINKISTQAVHKPSQHLQRKGAIGMPLLCTLNGIVIGAAAAAAVIFGLDYYKNQPKADTFILQCDENAANAIRDISVRQQGNATPKK